MQPCHKHFQLLDVFVVGLMVQSLDSLRAGGGRYGTCSRTPSSGRSKQPLRRYGLGFISRRGWGKGRWPSTRKTIILVGCPALLYRALLRTHKQFGSGSQCKHPQLQIGLNILPTSGPYFPPRNGPYLTGGCLWRAACLQGCLRGA